MCHQNVVRGSRYGYDALYRHSNLTRLDAKEAAQLPWIADCWASWLPAGGSSAAKRAAHASSSSGGGGGGGGGSATVDHSGAAKHTEHKSSRDAESRKSGSGGSGESLVTGSKSKQAPATDGVEDWRDGVEEDWRAGLSDIGRHLCEEAEDGGDEEAALTVPYLSESHDEGHDTEEEYEAALRAAGDQLDDLRYLRNELSPAGILALLDEEQRALEQTGASIALVAAGRYMHKRKASFSGMSLTKEISEEAYKKLCAQYKASATKRLDLSDEAFAGLTDAGLMELPSLFPAAQELFYDRTRVETDSIRALAKNLPQLRCGYLGGLLRPNAFDAAQEQYQHTRELDLTAAMQADRGAAEIDLALSEAALAELPGLFPQLETLFLPKAVAITSMQEKDQEQQTEHHLFRHAITQLKTQLPSLKVAHLGCEMTPTEYKFFAAEYASKQKLDDVYNGCYSDSALAEIRALWPYIEPSKMSRLENALATNAKLKQRNIEVERALAKAGRERLLKAEALGEREELLAQMLARSGLEDRYAQVAAADEAVRADNARYKAMIAEKEGRLSEYRRQIATQEALMRAREAQLLGDLKRLKELNATLDKLQGQPLSLLPVPQQLTQHEGTKLAPSPSAIRLAVGSSAAIEFKSACIAARATVLPERKIELAQITLKMAKTGDEAAICAALAQGADPNAANERDADETVLYFAAKAGHADCVAALLAAGACVERGGNEGWTPLMHAVNAGERECTEVCRLLLDAGANIAAVDNNGRTALDLAVECVRNAEEEGEDLDEEDRGKAQAVLALLRSVNAPSGADL